MRGRYGCALLPNVHEVSTVIWKSCIEDNVTGLVQRHLSLGTPPPLGLLLGWCGPLAVELDFVDQPGCNGVLVIILDRRDVCLLGGVVHGLVL